MKNRKQLLCKLQVGVVCRAVGKVGRRSVCGRFFSAAVGENLPNGSTHCLGDECGVGLEGYFKGCEKVCLGVAGLVLAACCLGECAVGLGGSLCALPW